MPVKLYSSRKTESLPKKIELVFGKLLSQLKKSRAHLEISVVGKSKIARLNGKYLGKNRVTDVLSFPQDWNKPPKDRPWILGEIVIALPVAKQQAKKAGRTLPQQLTRLAIHGLVHLSGLDHEKSSREAENFFHLEARWLKSLDRKGWMPWDGSLQL